MKYILSIFLLIICTNLSAQSPAAKETTDLYDPTSLLTINNKIVFTPITLPFNQYVVFDENNTILYATPQGRIKAIPFKFSLTTETFLSFSSLVSNRECNPFFVLYKDDLDTVIVNKTVFNNFKIKLPQGTYYLFLHNEGFFDNNKPTIDCQNNIVISIQ